MPSVEYRWDRATMGSRDRAQRGVYAMRVNEIVTGQKMSEAGFLLCPLTDELFHIDNGEVDKVTPSKGYRPGNIIMVSKAGNQGRSTLQQHHDDLPGIQRYRVNVEQASRMVDVPTINDAMQQWARTGRSTYHLKVLAGPYGEDA